MHSSRIKTLNSTEYRGGKVVYWMIRDQRVKDNWALIHAGKLAEKYNVSLEVVFCLRHDLRNAFGSARMLDFMLGGLKEVESQLALKNINFYVLVGDPETKILDYIQKQDAGYLVSDFNPLKCYRRWQSEVSKRIDIPFDVIDAHNIVPVWVASDKSEYSARFFRPKVNSFLNVYLKEFDQLKKQKKTKLLKNDFEKIRKKVLVREEIKLPPNIKPGTSSAYAQLGEFINTKINKYAKYRNDPNKDVLSNLSAFLHFGQISAQTVALEVQNSKINSLAKKTFLEELIVRRELSDNFVYYNKNYDSPKGFPNWAKESLNKHKKDKRQYIYSLEELENAKTHDKLWNAAQTQMVREGKMHGYMRMYWAKKVLEWSESPGQAFDFALNLNDWYELDGRDPNGYTGVAWSIGGVHDRPWFEREVYGKLRYMSFSGAKRKFDVDSYIKKYS